MKRIAGSSFTEGEIALTWLGYQVSTWKQSEFRHLLSTPRWTKLRATLPWAALQSLSTDATAASGSSSSASKTSSSCYRPRGPRTEPDEDEIGFPGFSEFGG